jgi:hypothetical protein
MSARPANVILALGSATRPRTTPARENPSAQSQRAFQPLPNGDPGEDASALRKDVDRIAVSREVRRFSAAQALLPEIADHPECLRRALRVIERERRAHRKIERQVFTRRQFEREVACDRDPGFAAHVERAGGYGVVGEVRESASSITRDAVCDFPGLEAQYKDGISNPSSLWSALTLDLPGMPGVRELRALKERARERRDEHNRYVDGVRGLVAKIDPDAALVVEHEAAVLRYFAVRDWQSLHEAQTLAHAGRREAIQRRRARVRILATHLAVGDEGGWSISKVARLVLASTNDWTKPPCRALVDDYLDNENDLAEVIRKDLERGAPKPQARRTLGQAGGQTRTSRAERISTLSARGK